MTQNYKYILKYLPISLLIVAGCAVEDEYDQGDPRPAGAPFTTTTSVLSVNATPGSKVTATLIDTVQIAFNNIVQLANQAQTQSATNRPVRIPYANNTPYRPIRASAAAQVRFLNHANGNSLGAVTSNFLVGTSYTVFLIDSTGRPGGNRVLQFSDNLAAPPTGQAKVRFFHFAPNAPRVVITNRNAGDAVVFSARTYAQTTPAALANFINLPAGTYDLDVRNDAAEGKPVVLPLNGVVLQAGKIYTVYARGFVGGTGSQALGASVILHN